ncbi:MAG: extracellular solute-binding protein [Clostridia bacterium]
MKKLLALALVLILVLASGAALAGESVVLYYSHAADWSDPIIKEFQDETGITVELVGAGTGELISRIIAESENPLGDILWGGVAESYLPIADYLEGYESPELQNLIPGTYDAETFKWSAFDIEPMVMVYSTKLVAPEDAPKRWDDLLNEKWKGQIACADPIKSSSSFATLQAIIAAYGQKDGGGFEFVKKFVPNLDGKVLSSSSGTYKGVSDGEYTIGLTYEEAALKYIAAGSEMAIVYPEEGTNVNNSPVAIIKNGPNTENAKKFVDFVLGKKVQEQLAALNRRSSRTDVELPANFLPTQNIARADYDIGWVVENTEAFKDLWKDLVTQ